MHPIERIPYKNVNTLFQAILHYICAVGVRYSYAVKQWEMIFPQINCQEWSKILENTLLLSTNTAIQNKKRELYYNLCIFMDQNNINHTTLNVTHLPLLQKNVSGIGVGCIAWCKKYFSLDSLSLRKKMSKEWQEKKFGRIGNLMILQIAGYT